MTGLSLGIAMLCMLPAFSVRARTAEPAELEPEPPPRQQPRHDTVDSEGPVAEETPGYGSLSLRTFWRSEDLIWSIAGGPINIRSELGWDDVRMGGLEAEGHVGLPNDLELRGKLAFGRIYDGELRDSDYDGSNRTLEFSRSRSKTKRGSVWDVSLALGWQHPLGNRLRVTPLVGLSYHQQNYNIRSGTQLIPPLGSLPLAGLDSDYDGEWYGFFWGGELRLLISERFEARVEFTSHHMAYRAEGHFNLRTDLADPSFTHSTVAEGSTFQAAILYALAEGWTLELDALYRAWEGDSGRTKFRFSDGGASRQRFNDIDLESLSLSLGLVLRF